MIGLHFNTDMLLEQIGQLENPLRQLLCNIVAEIGRQFDQVQASMSVTPPTKPSDTLAILAAVQHIFDSIPKADARTPDEFDGNSTKVETLLMSARTYFSLKQKALPNDRQKIIWALQFFVGKAEPWARGRLGLFHNPTCGDPYPDYATFEADVRVVFGAMNRATEARNSIFSMCQGEGETIGQFLHRFRPEADASELSDAALIHWLRQCLPATIQTSVAIMRGGVVPKRIIEWYETLHLIDQSQVMLLAILDSASVTNQSSQASKEETARRRLTMKTKGWHT